MVEIKVLSIEPTKDNKIKAIASIEIPHVAKIFGIKILQGDNSLYCHAPTQSYYQNGIKRWSNVILFEKKLWERIEEKVIQEYQKCIKK